jgi:phage FluMu gp28-like protein
MNKFVENAIDWLAKKAEVKIASDEKRALSKYTETVKNIAPKDLASNQDINVYYVDADTKFDDESIKALQDFAENGGGLLVAGLCNACIDNDMKPSDLPGNK